MEDKKLTNEEILENLKAQHKDAVANIEKYKTLALKSLGAIEILEQMINKD